MWPQSNLPFTSLSYQLSREILEGKNCISYVIVSIERCSINVWGWMNVTCVHMYASFSTTLFAMSCFSPIWKMSKSEVQRGKVKLGWSSKKSSLKTTSESEKSNYATKIQADKQQSPEKCDNSIDSDKVRSLVGKQASKEGLRWAESCFKSRTEAACLLTWLVPHARRFFPEYFT